jgi:two-component system chemotaxis response regulator CheY
MKKVLIVDDAAFMRMTLKLMLERNGFEVAGEAENGEVGVKKYKILKPDIVTMDCTMPEMNGIEALKLIKEFDSDCKVVIVSAIGQEKMVRKAILEGACNFIVKPFKEETLVNTLSCIK